MLIVGHQVKYPPGKHTIFLATVADFFGGKVDGNQQQVVFQTVHFGETFILNPTAISSEIGCWVGPKMPDPE